MEFLGLLPIGTGKPHLIVMVMDFFQCADSEGPASLRLWLDIRINHTYHDNNTVVTIREGAYIVDSSLRGVIVSTGYTASKVAFHSKCPSKATRLRSLKLTNIESNNGVKQYFTHRDKTLLVHVPWVSYGKCRRLNYCRRVPKHYRYQIFFNIEVGSVVISQGDSLTNNYH